VYHHQWEPPGEILGNNPIAGKTRDERAKENARHYVATSRTEWTDEEFFRTGEVTVAEQILTDMTNVCQGKRAQDMRVLEIGCGAGRVTRALASLFGEVHAVDISGEMVRLAREALTDKPNAFVYQNSGVDLAVVPSFPFDFAFSVIVFQHIPSREVVYSYMHEVHRLLCRGGLFKFQLQGHPLVESSPDDTWGGVAFSESDAKQMAEECGFEFRYSYGAGQQQFWLWFFKR